MASRALIFILFVVAVVAGVLVGAWLLPLTGYTGTGGVCVYSNSTVLEKSMAGQSAAKRLSQLAHEHDAKSDELKARLRYTDSKVTKRINETIQPLVKQAYKKHGCSVLLNKNDVLGSEQKNDLTADVITALNAKVKTVNFDLLPLPEKQADKGKSK